MNWSDYEGVWKRQELPGGQTADVGGLAATFETKRRKMAAVLQARDILEGCAGLIGTAGYGLAWWQLGRSGWPIVFAMGLVLGVVAVFVRERIRALRGQLGLNSSLLTKIDADIAELRHQRHLALGIWKWYLGPIAVSMVIVVGTLSHSRQPWDVARDPLFLGGLGVFFALMLWFAWEINRRAVRKQIDPRIEELMKLRREIDHVYVGGAG